MFGQLATCAIEMVLDWIRAIHSAWIVKSL